MIRPLEQRDWDTVIRIINENWKNIYGDYVSPMLLNEQGCADRGKELKKDFKAQRLQEYVWEEDGQVLALLSFGETADKDKAGTFELWRIYTDAQAQGKGIGTQLIEFAQQQAIKQGYKEMLIWAFKENTRAIRFYEKHGFSIDKEEYLAQPYNAWGLRLLKQL